MLSAHASPQPKRHLYRFSRLWTDDRGVSLVFTMVRLFPPQTKPHSHSAEINKWIAGTNYPLTYGPGARTGLPLSMFASGPDVIRGSLGPPESLCCCSPPCMSDAATKSGLTYYYAPGECTLMQLKVYVHLHTLWYSFCSCSNYSTVLPLDFGLPTARAKTTVKVQLCQMIYCCMVIE